MNNIDFVLLNLLLLIVFCHSGKMISRGYNYWQYARYCIITYTFVLGCRFARGTDYHGYSTLFASGMQHAENPMFSFINSILSLIGFNQYSCFIAYALVFVTCAMWFMKDYRLYAKYMFPCFLIGYILFEESMIRQAFSYSFFFLYIHQLFHIKETTLRQLWHNKKQLATLLLFWILTTSIHTGNLFSLILVTYFYFFYKHAFPPKIAIPFYIICTYILPNIFDYSLLNPILEFAANNNNLAAAYYENADIWFSKAGQQDIYEKNIIAEGFQVLGSSTFIFLAYQSIKYEKIYQRMLITILNMFIIGLCIESLFVKLEILHRIGQTIDQIGYLAIPFILFYRPLYTSNYKILFLFLFWFTYYYIKYCFYSPWAMFIWDTPYSLFFS